MRKILMTGAAAMLCAAAFPAIAAPSGDVTAQDQSSPQSDQATQQPRARDDSRRVCVSENMSNSRLSRRVCRTQAEWDEMRRTGELITNR